jgi:DNA-binding NtrC family response regulator
LKTILVVDDDEEFRKMLSAILTDKGYLVKCVGTGKEAIDESYDQLFNLALVDIDLPDIVGTDLLDKLRKAEPETIKIIITGKPTLDNSINAANIGINGFIVKPFDPKKLLKLIEEKLREQDAKMKFDEKKVSEYIESRHEWMAESKLRK